MNGTHQVLAYADDVNSIGDDIRIERNADVLFNVCKVRLGQGLDMNGTHQVLAYADDVNLIGDDIRIERNADVLLNACKDIDLAVNIGKTKYVEIGRHRGIIANEHDKIGSNSYEKVKTFKYFGSLLTNQNSNQEEIKCRLKAGNSCYYLVQILFYSRLLSRI